MPSPAVTRLCIVLGAANGLRQAMGKLTEPDESAARSELRAAAERMEARATELARALDDDVRAALAAEVREHFGAFLASVIE